MTVGSTISHIWCHMSLILGIFGNSYVLFATICHKAIKLDKMSVWIIQNMAVVDILSCLLFQAPVLTTLYSGGEWVLGDVMCDVYYVYKYSFPVANILLLNLLSLNKLLRCVFPLRNMVTSRRQMVAVTAVAACWSAVVPVWSYYSSFSEDFAVVKFYEAQGMCGANNSPEMKEWQKLFQEIRKYQMILK